MYCKTLLTGLGFSYKGVCGEHSSRNNGGNHNNSRNNHKCVKDDIHLIHSHNSIYPEDGSHSNGRRNAKSH